MTLAPIGNESLMLWPSVIIALDTFDMKPLLILNRPWN